MYLKKIILTKCGKELGAKWHWGGHFRGYSSPRESRILTWSSGNGNDEMQLDTREFKSEGPYDRLEIRGTFWHTELKDYVWCYSLAERILEEEEIWGK